MSHPHETSRQGRRKPPFRLPVYDRAMGRHPIDTLEILLANGARSRAQEAAALVSSSIIDSSELVQLLAAVPGAALIDSTLAKRVDDVTRGVATSSNYGRTEATTIPGSLDGWAVGSPFSLFEERFKDALVHVGGLSSTSAKIVAAAFHELADNPGQHSSSTMPALAAYEVLMGGGWAFSVTDLGRGIGASVREREPSVDDQAAVRMALKEGWSRTGELGRGFGFSTVFKVLVDRNCLARIRSGTAAASWHGQSPTAQTLEIQGVSARVGCHVSVRFLGAP